jgi:nicotinamide-nucleotide amidase
MALQTRARFHADVAVAVSGIAGPGGGSPEKPVGLVWFGLADAAGWETHRMIFPGTRHEIRVRAAQYAPAPVAANRSGCAAGRRD